jgi:hypothetical protein
LSPTNARVASSFQTIATRLRADKDWSVSAFDAYHDVVRTHPTDVAGLIEEVIAKWEGAA